MGGLGTVPPEAWDHTNPDHEWWVGGRGWCFDDGCPNHTYREPGQPEPDRGPGPAGGES